MLCELRIRDFAIIEDLVLTFRQGLNVITGETGAGKSIILQALALVAGGRAQPDVVRTGQAEASIEALFEADLPEPIRDDFGIGATEELLVRREISSGGKGRIRLNGGPATVAMLGRLGAHLVHLYGQHDQTLLLRPANHLDFLDRFGDLSTPRTRMRDAYATLIVARRQLEESAARRKAAEERRELLTFQLGELRAAGLHEEEEEEEELRRERSLIRSAERIHSICREGDDTLYARKSSVVNELARLAAQLTEVRDVAPDLGPSADLVETARIQLEEAALQLRAQAARLQFEPQRLAELEERLATLVEMGRKYGVPSKELPALLQQLTEELAQIESAAPAHEAASKVAAERERDARAIAKDLSARRARVATKLEKRLARELAELGMHGAVFQVTLQPRSANAATDRLTESGVDEVEFYLSANPGEAPRPLTRVASGGELSRILLALEALTAAAIGTPILIFDEVDAGIGGAVADAVGRRLKKIAASRQLLCITHLPQIAAYADHHYAVAKHRQNDRTMAEARLLGPSERVQELSRMLGGGIAPDEAESYARRLIEQGQAPPRA